ncbi:MAG: FAD-dependent oxidoreductase [Pseudomonadota bacterium]
MSRGAPIVILGAGHAGGRSAEWLRRLGYDGELILLGAEPYLPYERPPLSKGLLTGAQAPADCHLQDEGFYRDNGIELRLGDAASALSPRDKRVTLADGATLAFGKLVIATGARPRRLALPGGELEGVCYLRDIAHSLELIEHLTPGARLVVVGGGFIGLEVAASARKQGAEVVVLEAAPQVLGRGLPASVAEDMVALHAAEGVEICTGAQLASIEGQGRVSAVTLKDGTRLEASAVLIGVGIVPNVELAAAAGLPCDDGILAGTDCATEALDIFVVGDTARATNARYGRQIRLESWQNAEQQAEIAARAVMGEGPRWEAVPWVWSDQHGWNLQVTGFPTDGAHFVARGRAAEGKALGFALDRDGALVGATALGQGLSAAKDLRVAQMLIERGARPDPAALADPSANLKALLKQSQAA